MKIVKTPALRRLGLATAVLFAFVVGLSLRGGTPDTDRPEDVATEAEEVVWTCSMHPQIRLPEPGQCPICGMDLVALESPDETSDTPRSLTLSAEARRRAEVETTPVRRRPAEKQLRMVGKLEPDETRVREITAWVPGRIDRLHVDYTGVAVRRGDELFDIYSPELYSAQRELLQAIDASRQLEKSPLESTRRSATRTIGAARERLRLWGLTLEQVERIEARGAPSDHVSIVAPAGGVVLEKRAVEGAYVQTGTPVYTIADLSLLWLRLDVYESDLAWVELGQTVTFETDSYPGEKFTGIVAFIDPTLNERTRSVKVRVDVTNPEGRLKPGMFARAVVHAEIDGEDGRPPLVVPASAPLVTGTRAVVYVEDPSLVGVYRGREIVLGPRAGDLYVVREGLEEGELVVSNGSFKIDSAMQIHAKPSMMSPEGEGSTPSHRHDPVTPPAPEPSSREAAEAISDIPDAFRAQLDDVLAGYLEVGTALSQEDLPAARAAATELLESLGSVDPGPLPAAGHDSWAEMRRDLDTAAKGIVAAGDIAVARRDFYDLSVRAIDAVRRFGVCSHSPLFVFHCPMAMDGAGADWIQSTESTINPYYGSRMEKCGSKAATLVPAPDPDEPDHGHR